MADQLQGVSAIPVWLLASDEISVNGKMVYLALLTFIDRDRECWPSHAAIARRCATSIPSVKRGLAELRAAEIVTWKKRWRPDSGQSSNHYVLRVQ